MIIGRVIGTIVASRKHERLVGSKIQIVQPRTLTCKRLRVIPSWPSMPWVQVWGNWCC